MTTKNTRRTLAALAIALPLSLAACGSSDTNADAGKASPSPAMSDSMTKTTDAMTATPSPSAMADAMAQVFGPGCAAVPKDGSGSFNGMATDPVATAASHNPLLTTLVTAVTTAGLGDTLNSAPAITVFAPVNDAFAKVPAADLKALLANKPALTKVLTNHVVAGKIAPEKLAGEHKTLAGTTIKVTGAGEEFTVGKANAKVICGNVPTANATVYIIDGVLLP